MSMLKLVEQDKAMPPEERMFLSTIIGLAEALSKAASRTRVFKEDDVRKLKSYMGRFKKEHNVSKVYDLNMFAAKYKAYRTRSDAHTGRGRA